MCIRDRVYAASDDAAEPDRAAAELADVVAGTEFKLFAGAIEAGGVVKAIAVPEGKRISNSRLKPKGDVFNEAIAGGAAERVTAGSGARPSLGTYVVRPRGTLVGPVGCRVRTRPGAARDAAAHARSSS